MSMYITDKTLRTALARALSGSKCIQAWLGYGSVIFIGLGTDEKDLKDLGRHFPVPPYQIVADVASQWIIYDASRVQCDSGADRDTRESGLAQLVGMPVAEWRFCAGTGKLLIRFAEGIKLEVRPNSSFRNNDAVVWRVRQPSGYVYERRLSGALVRVHKDEPPSTPVSRRSSPRSPQKVLQ